MDEITEGTVDFLEIASVHVAPPEFPYSTYELIFVMRSNRIKEDVYGQANYYADGQVMCISHSELGISVLAKKRLRKLIHEITIEIVRKLRAN